MSHATAPKSHALAWTISALAVVLLYVALWPVVEITVSSGRLATPSWARFLYRPLDYLALLHGADNPLAHYHQWWWRKLNP